MSFHWQEHVLRRVLVMRLDNVGDVVMIGPTLRTLRRWLPDSHITLMVSPAGSQVAPLLPWHDATIVHRAIWQDASGAMAFDPGREAALVERLRGGRFDAAVILTSFSQSPHPAAYACYQAGIPIRLGQSKEFAGGVLWPTRKPPPDETHQVDRSLLLLESAGFEPVGHELEIRLDDADRTSADRLLRETGVEPEEPFIALAPGASCPARTYPAERFGEAVSLLGRRLDWPVVLLGSPRETAMGRRIVASAGSSQVRWLLGRTSVGQLAALLARCRLLLASHSGPMHLADALRRPMVILFSGTDLPSQWRPRSAPAVLLGHRPSCSPCGRFECPYQMECLAVSPQEVVEAACGLLVE